MILNFSLKTYSNTALLATKQEVAAAKNKRVVDIIAHNPNAAVSYVQFFDALAADVTVGTTAPAYAVGIPANSTVIAHIGPRHHVNGITIAATTTATGNTAPGAAVVISLAIA